MPEYLQMNLKVGDQRPYLEVELQRADGKPLNLTGASVLFSMRSPEAMLPKVDEKDMVITSATKGRAEYHWDAADTDTPGFYNGEVTVVWPGGERETQPADGFIIVHVVARA